jgi:iron complex outermembrane receptor protein
VTGVAVGGLECHGTAQSPAAPPESGARDTSLSRGHTFCNVLAPTGRLGVTVGLGEVELLGAAGRYVRVPTLGELFGVSDAVRGNATLQPETSWSGDLGARYMHRLGAIAQAPVSLHADATGFGRFSDDLVSYARAAAGYVVPINIDRARILGVEGVVALDWGAIVFAELAATLLDPRDTTEGRTTVNDVLPYRSRSVLVPRLRYASPALGWVLSRAGAEARYVYQSSRVADRAGLAVIPEQGMLDLEAQAQLFGGTLRLRARVANALDQRRTDVIGFPLPGRSFYLSMETTPW